MGGENCHSEWQRKFTTFLGRSSFAVSTSAFLSALREIFLLLHSSANILLARANVLRFHGGGLLQVTFAASRAERPAPPGGHIASSWRESRRERHNVIEVGAGQ
jgi:hypothetical protein